MAAEFDFDKLMAAAQEAVSNPAAAAKTSTESLLVNPAAAAPAPAPKPPLAPAPLAEAAPAPKPPLAPAPKWPLDAAPKTPPHEVPPPWRATPSSATAAKTRPRGPATVPDPRVATIGNKYKLIGGQWQQVQSDRPISSAEKAGVVFPAVPPAVRPVAPSKAGRVAPRVVAPPAKVASVEAVVAPPAKVASVEAVVSVAAPEEAAPAPAPVETPAPAQAPATAAAAAKTAACPFKALGIPLPPPAVVRPVAALDADAAQRSIGKRHGPRGTNENSQWHTAMHRAKLEGPKALCEFYRAWPKPLKKQKTEPDA